MSVRGFGLVLVLLLGLAPAAPAETVVLGLASPRHEWIGHGVGVAHPWPTSLVVPHSCGATTVCDEILVKTEARGDLVASVNGLGAGQDLDLTVYRSDAEGRKGTAMAGIIDCYSDERVRVHDAEPGFYLVEVYHFYNADLDYQGRVWLVGADDPGPPWDVEPLLPDRGRLTRENPLFEFDAGPVTGAYYCHEDHRQALDYRSTLLHVADAGTLSVAIEPTNTGTQGLSATIYRSDATGFRGAPVGAAVGYPGGRISKVVESGWYVIAQYLDYVVEGTWHGRVKLTPAPGAPPPVTLPQVAPPNGPPRVVVRRVGARRLRGTAADDDRVVRVVASLRRRARGRCRDLTGRGVLGPARACSRPAGEVIARGTSEWSVRLRRPLPAGRYTLSVRATDQRSATSAPAVRTFQVP